MKEDLFILYDPGPSEVFGRFLFIYLSTLDAKKTEFLLDLIVSVCLSSSSYVKDKFLFAAIMIYFYNWDDSQWDWMVWFFFLKNYFSWLADLLLIFDALSGLGFKDCASLNKWNVLLLTRSRIVWIITVYKSESFWLKRYRFRWWFINNNLSFRIRS